MAHLAYSLSPVPGVSCDGDAHLPCDKTFGRLPDHIIEHIVGYLEDYEKRQFSRINKRTYMILRNSLLMAPQLASCGHFGVPQRLTITDSTLQEWRRVAGHMKPLCMKNIRMLVVLTWGYSKYTDFDCLENLVSLKLSDRFNEFSAYLRYKFPNLQSLEIIHGSTLMELDLLEMKSLRKISFEYGFDKSICPLAHCHSLTHLNLGNWFSKTIDPLASLQTLVELKIGNRFNQPIDALATCDALEYIELGDSFDKPIINVCCTRLRAFKVGHAFNQSIEIMRSWNFLETLKLGDTFNQPIDALGCCSQLRDVSLGMEFDKSIVPLGNCQKLQKLELVYKFTTNLISLQPCKSLCYLVLNSGYSFSLNKVCEILPQVRYIGTFNSVHARN